MALVSYIQFFKYSQFRIRHFMIYFDGVNLGIFPSYC
jgi:hypothetical protein